MSTHINKRFYNFWMALRVLRMSRKSDAASEVLRKGLVDLLKKVGKETGEAWFVERSKSEMRHDVFKWLGREMADLAVEASND